MDNMKLMLENQQKVNEAVKTITDYFREVDYDDELELAFTAQTQIIGLMELAKRQAINSPMHEAMEFNTDSLTTFMQVIREYLHMLKPFAKMVE